MLAAAIVSTVYSCVLLLIGIIFWALSRYVVGRFDRSVTGQVTDLTGNAAQFNEEQGHGEAALFTKGSRFPIAVSISSGKSSYRRSSYHKVFTYTVNGQTYTRADGVSYSKNLAMKWLDKEVTVYYDSSNPANASLSNGRGPRLVSCILLPIGIGLLVLAVWLWMQL